MHDIIADIGRFIFVEDEPAASDIVIIVGSSEPDAAELAARLWREGYAPRVFAGGGVSVKTGRFPGPRARADVYAGDYRTEYEFYRDVLIKNGVPAEAIVGEDRSGYTRQNAECARARLDELGLSPRRALLVCKAFHARRALMFFGAAFPATELRVITYPGHDVTRDNWFMSEYGIKRVLGELGRLGTQFGPDDVKTFLLRQANAERGDTNE